MEAAPGPGARGVRCVVPRISTASISSTRGAVARLGVAGAVATACRGNEDEHDEGSPPAEGPLRDSVGPHLLLLLSPTIHQRPPWEIIPPSTVRAARCGNSSGRRKGAPEGRRADGVRGHGHVERRSQLAGCCKLYTGFESALKNACMAAVSSGNEEMCSTQLMAAMAETSCSPDGG